MLAETDPALVAALGAAVGPSRVAARPIDRIAWASDASFYRLVPQAVVHAASAADAKALFALSHARQIPLTFRAAGTSLSGQAVTDGILVEVARGMRRVVVEDRGARVRLQPGVIGEHANRALAPYGRKIGPDPASIATCAVSRTRATMLRPGSCCAIRPRRADS